MRDAPARRQPRSQGESSRSAPRSPLTRTVTRIVEVVPAPLRYALAGLALMALLLAAAFGAAALRARRSERRRRRIAADAGLLQSALLPPLPGRVGRAFVSAAYRPADGPAAGGDFYDAFALDEHRTCVIVGDVAGHGREALPLTAIVRYTVRAYLETGLTPRLALQLAGSVLAPQLREQLVTVVAAVYDASSGRLTYASAGHPAPVLVGESGDGRDAAASPPLGSGVVTGRRQVTVALPPGTAACFYTDGLLDARRGNARVGHDGFRRELAALGAGCSARDVLSRLVAHSDSQPDDMAALILRAPEGAAVPPAGRIDELELEMAEIRSGRAGRFLAMLGIADEAAAAALRTASAVAARAGTAVVVIRSGTGAAEVTVDPPGAVALRLPGTAGRSRLVAEVANSR